MLPDVLGYKVSEGLSLLADSGVDPGSIVIKEYYSPKVDIIGNDVRILRINEIQGSIILIVGNF